MLTTSPPSVSRLSSHNLRGLHALLLKQRYFLYTDDVGTSQEISLWASTVCYGDSFTLLYVDDVRTSQETPKASTASYEDSFTFLYVDDVCTSQETP
jgi:hypothetical protein